MWIVVALMQMLGDTPPLLGCASGVVGGMSPIIQPVRPRPKRAGPYRLCEDKAH